MDGHLVLTVLVLFLAFCGALIWDVHRHSRRR